MTENELEEFRYDVAHALLKRMSKGTLFQVALDRMLFLISDATEEELSKMVPQLVKKQKKKNKAKGF